MPLGCNFHSYFFKAASQPCVVFTMFTKRPIGSNPKAALASRVTNLMRSSEIADKNIFMPVELSALEQTLKESFVKKAWVEGLMTEIVENGAVVSKDKQDG